MFKLATLLLRRLVISDPEEVHVVTDVPYATGGGHKQQLDLYLPGGNSFPTIIFVHGGSLVSGDRKGFPQIEPYREIGVTFAQMGIGMVVLSYRLGPREQMADHGPGRRICGRVDQAEEQYLRRRFHEDLSGRTKFRRTYRIRGSYERSVSERSRPSLKGLAGCIVLGSSLHPSYDIEGRDPEELSQVSERANKVGGYESVFPSPQDYRDADPCFHVNKDVPTFLIIFGDDEAERTPALEHADQFAGLLDDVGVRSDVEVVDNQTHMGLLQRMAEEGDPTVMLIKRFLKKR